MPLQTLCVFVGAGGGALVRWRIGDWTRHLFPSFPPGTTIVNLAGCLLIGLAAGWFASRHDASPELRLLVVTGFLGGFTTFSAFSLETLTLWSERPVVAFLYALGTVIACLLLTFVGMIIIRRLVSGG